MPTVWPLWRTAQLVLLALGRWQLNEAARLHHRGWQLDSKAEHWHANEDYEALLDASAPAALNAVLAKTTLADALQVLERREGVSAELRDLVEDVLGQQQRSGRRASGLRGGAHDLAFQRFGGSPDKARGLLNKMIEETQKKLDLEQIKGAGFARTQKALIETCQRQRAAFSAQSSAARGKVLAAQGKLSALKRRIPELQQALADHKSKCKKEDAALERQLNMTEQDAKTMQGVMNATTCSDGGGGSSLLECSHEDRRASFAAFVRGVVRPRVARLRSPATRRAAQLAVQSAVQEGRPAAGGAEPRRARLLQAAGAAEAVFGNLTATTRPPDPKTLGKQKKQCVARGSPSCKKLNDRFWQILSGVMDKADDIKASRADLHEQCKALRTNLETQLSGAESKAKDSAAGLAAATQMQTEAQEESSLKATEANDLEAEYHNVMKGSGQNVKAFQREICGLKKIRTELYTIQNQTVLFQDCAVSEWTMGECSASCEGGVRKLVRTVVSQQANGGTSCPPLEVQQRCGQQPCPVDCKLDDWDGWGACTAQCGGGVMQRARTVRTEPRNGGVPCGDTSETVSCNVQACDKDCTLSDWQGWSTCSKMCDGGLMQRKRKVSQAALGSGKCPGKFSDARLDYKPCNPHPCSKQPGALTLQCASKLDVTLLLDGSGSLKASDFNATKRAASLFAQALGNETLLSVILFSGPASWPQFLLCTRGAGPGQAPPDMDKDCGIRWVVRGSNNSASAAAKIEGMAQPGRSTLTSAALATAAADLRNGRRDAQSVVVVITDGKPMSPRKTGLASTNLRKKARLMWVPVTTLAPLDEVKEWASRPVKENVIKVPSYHALEEPSTVSTLIANMCPVVS